MSDSSPLGGYARSLLGDLARSNQDRMIPARAQDAFGVGCRLFRFIEESVQDPSERKKLQLAWLKAVRDGDFKKFKRAWNRYLARAEGSPEEPPADP